jgi:putative endonuclease
MENKSKNREKGSFGEKLAAKELIKKGYEIVDFNFCRRGGEIDIIAKKDDIYVFVEVKLRKSLSSGAPCEAVDTVKQKRIIETAQKYIAEKNILDFSFRFDVIEILQLDKIYMRHIENAFWRQ